MSGSLPDRFQRLEPLLDRALELEGAERERFLVDCAAVHPDLIRDLRRALAGDDALPELGALAAGVVRERTTDRRNLRAGPWRLLEKLGRGGMGTVYLAERADGAFDKRVAIKLLRSHDRERFREHLERERRLLARLDHPSVARLIDAGVTRDDQPYLVMELAQGLDLDAWARTHRPSLRRRLQVLQAVCGAVGAAHSHLIVHRDLKPSNIRVDAHDRIKLLDFGIAKLLEEDGGGGDETRSLALTPEFAAPEQLQRGVVTTRADVYALGALLYLLLTGRSPHPRFTGDWPAMIEAVTAREAIAPSVEARSKAGAPVPARLLRGDLDAICRRALARDPAHRYASAEALAEDLQRHLDGRPVRARAATAGYRAGRWARRHWLVTTVLLVAAALSALLAVGLARRVARSEAARTAAVTDAESMRVQQAAWTAEVETALGALARLHAAPGQADARAAFESSVTPLTTRLGEAHPMVRALRAAAPAEPPD
ncbi:MAG TPA: serine/threonine-protein kinase [Xanthomonadaceae bacterium]|nr:serine/threonine-protein kinase [Xanthomonadaceae bacterium]